MQCEFLSQMKLGIKSKFNDTISGLSHSILFAYFIRKSKMLQLKMERRKEAETSRGGSTVVTEEITEESPAVTTEEIAGESLDLNANVVNTLGNCFFCGKLTALLCRFCQGVYYCSEVTIPNTPQKV